jgi:hypothetical protein
MYDGFYFDFVPADNANIETKVIYLKDSIRGKNAQAALMEVPVEGLKQTTSGAKQIFRFDAPAGFVQDNAELDGNLPVIHAPLVGGNITIAEDLPDDTFIAVLPNGFTLENGRNFVINGVEHTTTGFAEPVLINGKRAYVLNKVNGEIQDLQEPAFPIAVLQWAGQRCETVDGELVETDVNRAVARKNLDIVTKEEAINIITNAPPNVVMVDVVVENGEITLPGIGRWSIYGGDVKWIRIQYPEGYDTIRVVEGSSASKFKVYDTEEGDLDGTTVSARYIQHKDARLVAK